MEQNTQEEKIGVVTLPIDYVAIKTEDYAMLVAGEAKAEAERDAMQSRFWDYRSRFEEIQKRAEELTAENKKLAAELKGYRDYFNNQVGAKADYVMWLNGREDEEI